MELGRVDLSIARLAEAHSDALALFAEHSKDPRTDSLYGVWASDGPNSQLIAAQLEGGRWRLDGIKQYCSGATLVDRALVTAHHGDELLLFNVSLSASGVEISKSTWVNAGLSDTCTCPVIFHGVKVGVEALVGGANGYLSRPGFWHGAVGPAACWAGGAISLIDAASALNKKDPHSRAQVGALQSIGWGLTAVLTHAGREIDSDPEDTDGNARTRALKVRHLIERWCTEVLDRFGRATGPQLLAFDDQIARQYASLTVYIRQCHAERDLDTIAL
jgi:alkylation response protein AidB-like acyl-CoA dehydrogenase